MRITFVLAFPDLSGGVRVIANFAEQLRRRGHVVNAIAQPAQPVSFRERARSLVKARRWLQRAMPGPYFDELGVQPQYLDRRRPVTDADVPDADVVIATWWETGEWVAGLSPRKGVKAHFLQQYEANFGFPDERVAAVWRLPLRKIVCSKWLADLARDRFGDPSAVVVPNGIDTGLFQAPPRQRQRRPTVGMMYSHPHHKGCDVALQAISTAAKRIQGLHLVAFGANHPSDRLPLPPGAEFIFRPEQRAIRDIYARCDAWLCASWSEGFHLPPHEAMACRCPVVSTRVGGPMDMVRDGVNGYLVDPGDAETLADRLVDMLNGGEERWQAMSEAAYETAIQYTWEGATDLFEAALKSMVEYGRSELYSTAPKVETERVKGSTPLDGDRANRKPVIEVGRDR